MSVFPHHKVISQNLYSTKALGDKAFSHEFTTAQARSDVFFSLLFGGQICYSAGAFFDSPVAIRVFGELCSHPSFDSTCDRFGWRPLWLNTDRLSDAPADRPSAPSATDFILSRWRDPVIQFSFFRERESWIEPGKLRDAKSSACAALANRQYGLLGDLDILFHSYQVEGFDRSLTLDQMSAGEGERSVSDTPCIRPPHSIELPPILNHKVGIWFEFLLYYLSKYEMIHDRQSILLPDLLGDFSPLRAIEDRIISIDSSNNNYSIDELRSLNESFWMKLSAEKQKYMNPIHTLGPAHFGHYYPLVEDFIEVEWHRVRKEAYGASSCILASNWQHPDVFGFDDDPKLFRSSNVRIDESLEFEQRGFAEFSWDTLFQMVTDSKWRSLVYRIKIEENPDARRKNADQILDLLARKISDVEFDQEGGIVRILSNRISKSIALAGYAGILYGYHDAWEGLVGSRSAYISEGIGWVAAGNARGSRLVAKGVKYGYRVYNQRQLRRAMVSVSSV